VAKNILKFVLWGVILFALLALSSIALWGTFSLRLGCLELRTHHLNVFYGILFLAFISREVLNGCCEDKGRHKNSLILEKIIQGRFSNLSCFIFIAVFSFLFFYSQLSNYFFLDDFFFINRIRSIDSLNGVFSLFTSPFPFGVFYKPVFLLSFLLNYKMFGTNPFGYNLTNLLLHVSSLCLFYYLVFRITKSKRAAFFSLFVYLLNFDSYHLTVSWISARNDSLAALFMLLALNCYVTWEEYGRKGRYLFLTCLLWLAALLSKESAVVLPLLLIVYKIVKGGGSGVRGAIADYLKILLLFAGLGCVYFVIRYYVGARMPVIGEATYTYSLGKNILSNLIEYIKETLIWSLVPFWLMLAYIQRIKKVTIPKESRGLIVFGVCFFICAVLPVLALPHTAGQYYYLPLFGSSISLGVMLDCLMVRFYRQDNKLAQRALKNILLFSLIAIIPYIIMDNRKFKVKAAVTKGILQELKEEYPALPENSTIFIMDEHNALKSYTSAYLSDAVKLIYDDDTIMVVVIQNKQQLSQAGKTIIFYKPKNL